MQLDDHLFRTIVDSMAHGAYLVDTRRIIQYWNPAACSITGYAAESVIGKRCADDLLAHVDEDGQTLCKGKCPLAATLSDGVPRHARVFLRHKEGHRVPVGLSVGAVRDTAGAIVGAVETFRDDSPLMAGGGTIGHIEGDVTLCPVCGIADRGYSERVLEQRIEEAKRNETRLGVMFINIDRFKDLNVAMGHRAGDLVLKMVARTLANSVHAHDFVGRWGGGEFIAILPTLKPLDIEPTGNRFRALVEHSSRSISENRIRVTASVGAVFLSSNDTVTSVVERVSRLMFESSKRGGNCVIAEKL